ncbi:hypothetical protein KKG90_05350 [Candidatus Bipolaricaulota bacterium]|nr:hypothetical protein [Candidatus Bipolaricaulota bacterium]
MKLRFWIVLGLVIAAGLVLFAQSDGNSGDSPAVSEPYFGEMEPGRTPRAFARNILGRDLHTPPIFSPDGASVYWCTMDGGDIQWMRFEDGAWQSPEIIPFAANSPFPIYSDSPFLSADGSRMYFNSWRSSHETIWYSELTEAGWGSPEQLPFETTPPRSHWGFSVTEAGTLYFGSDGEIYVADLSSGVYTSPRPIGPPISTDGREEMPYVAKDGSYMLFASDGHPNSLGDYDLYLSIRQPNAAWGEPIHLPSPVNTTHRDMYPTMSPDGEYLFFLSNRYGDPCAFWVDASVVTDLLP